MDQLAKEILDQDEDPLAGVHYTDLKPLAFSYIQQLVQTKWGVAVHSKDFYLVKLKLGPPKKFQHLTRAEEVVISRLRIGHTKVTKSHTLSRGPPTTCHHCGQTLSIDHMLLECHEGRVSLLNKSNLIHSNQQCGLVAFTWEQFHKNAQDFDIMNIRQLSIYDCWGIIHLSHLTFQVSVLQIRVHHWIESFTLHC